MSKEGQPPARPAAQAGSSGKAEGVGLEVGGVHSNADLSWLDLWGLNPETRAYLEAARRNATCTHAPQRNEGAGDGSKEITTPEKLRKFQRALYRKAKDHTSECLAMKRLGKPDTGNPSVRFDEGSESDGHWRKPFNPSAPAYSTSGAWRMFEGRPYYSHGAPSGA